jgi:hypothetical protein
MEAGGGTNTTRLAFAAGLGSARLGHRAHLLFARAVPESPGVPSSFRTRPSWLVEERRASGECLNLDVVKSDVGAQENS